MRGKQWSLTVERSSCVATLLRGLVEPGRVGGQRVLLGLLQWRGHLTSQFGRCMAEIWFLALLGWPPPLPRASRFLLELQLPLSCQPELGDL